ncbi:MAG TPA: hypothetical protein PK027_10160 [Aquimonas sp.]|jgi:hypothetical protein|nr:hypothetical protein [Aquimonas sp.]HRF54804.1 hypothetical protein [Aquimonas sp.]
MADSQGMSSLSCVICGSVDGLFSAVIPAGGCEGGDEGGDGFANVDFECNWNWSNATKEANARAISFNPVVSFTSDLLGAVQNMDCTSDSND